MEISLPKSKEMTHTIKSNNKNWCFVEVPEDLIARTVNLGQDRTRIWYRTDSCTSTWSMQSLPPGQWSIHADSSAMTEALAAEVVTNEGTKARPIYTDYSDPFRSMFLSVASLDTLAASLGITGRYFILQST